MRGALLARRCGHLLLVALGELYGELARASSRSFRPDRTRGSLT